MRRPYICLLFLVTTPVCSGRRNHLSKAAKGSPGRSERPADPTISVSPHRDYAILMQPVRYPSIAEVAQPMLRLAGIRIDSNTNGMHLAGNRHLASPSSACPMARIFPSRCPRTRSSARPSGVPTEARSRFPTPRLTALNSGSASPRRDRLTAIEGAVVNGVRTGGGGGAGGRRRQRRHRMARRQQDAAGPSDPRRPWRRACGGHDSRRSARAGEPRPRRARRQPSKTSSPPRTTKISSTTTPPPNWRTSIRTSGKIYAARQARHLHHGSPFAR